MSDNPYTASAAANSSESRPKPPRRFSAIELLAVAVVILALVALLLPATRSARPAARRMACGNNLKMIALALQNYAVKYDALPPAYTVDSDGIPLHSWRTLILPFLDHQSLYDQIDLSKRWDDPVHAAIKEAQFLPYWCPSTSVANGQTTYLAVVGTEAGLHPTSPRPLADFLDGLSNTILIVEVAPDDTVHWMSPQDADEPMVLLLGSGASPAHSGGSQIALADGSVRFLPWDTPASTRRTMLTISVDDTIE